jgi:hypothetical protein
VSADYNETINKILHEIHLERHRQMNKWGVQVHPNGTDPTLRIIGGYARDLLVDVQGDNDHRESDGTSTWFRILFEEVLEAAVEQDEIRLREELVQIAAVAVAWVEDIDREEEDE